MKILLVIAVVLLTACESEFDKCMTAEVPRAEESLGLSGAYSRLERAREYVEVLAVVTDVDDRWKKWGSLNPGGPEYPKYECEFDASDDDFEQCSEKHDLKKAEYKKERDAYEASPEYQEWLAKEADFVASIAPEFNAVGVAGSTKDELGENYSQWDDSYDDLRLVRARRFDCWGQSPCERPQSAELAHTFGSRWYRDDDIKEQVDSFEAQEGTRLVEYFSDELIALQAKPPEVATLMCNRAGIYE